MKTCENIALYGLLLAARDSAGVFLQHLIVKATTLLATELVHLLILVIATRDDETVRVFYEEGEEQEEDFAGVGTYKSPKTSFKPSKIDCEIAYRILRNARNSLESLEGQH